MNERVFNYEIGSNAEKNKEALDGKELYFDHTKTRDSRINNAARSTDKKGASSSNNFVISSKMESPSLSTLASTNSYYL
jgi:hypothetical protein